MLRALIVSGLIISRLITSAQTVVWAEEFENSCTQGCYASAYSGVNGAWSVINTGANGACPNRWFISCQENGNAVGACGSGCGTNESLHVGNELVGVCASPSGCIFCPGGDCGAAYDAGCPVGLCAFCFCGCLSTLTDQRAQSPVINLTGQTTLTLTFKYMENGEGSLDNATLWYYNGLVWAQLADMPKTTICGGGQGQWTSYSIALPASANNNPNVRIGFRWVNDNNANGADPSIAVDDVQITIPYAPIGVGLIVNELSNGPSTNKEYIELLAVGPACTTIDARLIKVDDNNGVSNNGFGNTMTNSGAATGHIRFSNAAQWATVPVGSLILIYNELDRNALIPPDDPSDLAPHDSIYILPANSPFLQGCATFPDGNISSGYNPCAFGAGVWTYIGMRNAGDAGQTRDANGRYFHGISYGSNVNNMNNGGLDNLRISAIDHTGRVLFFNNGNFRLAANFTSAVVAGNETPAAVNNPANASFRHSLECVVLPIELVSFTANAMADRVRTEWITASEFNNDYFTLERSADGFTFESIGTVHSMGDSQQARRYVFDDPDPLRGISYYRLKQTDYDGMSSSSNIVAVAMSSPIDQPLTVLHQYGDVVALHNFPIGSTMEIFDLSGRLVISANVEREGRETLPTSELTRGAYVLRFAKGDHAESTRFIY